MKKFFNTVDARYKHEETELCDCTVQIFISQCYASLRTKRRFANRGDYYGRNYDYQLNERHVVAVSKIIVV